MTGIIVLLVMAVLLLATLVIVGLDQWNSNREAHIHDRARRAEWKLDQLTRSAAMAMMDEARKHLPDN